MKQIITASAPEAVGPYSQAIVSAGLVYTSGQLPIDPRTGRIESADIAGQTARAIENLIAVLEAAGSSARHVVKTTCYLRDLSDFATFNEVYARYFTTKPARSCIEASALPKGALLEIDAVAEIMG